jgi:predicted regulator of Ras-like GTPase activity (Roadblock/LC7/MglB family)
MDSARIPEEWDRHFGSVWRELELTLKHAGAATAVLVDTSGNAVTYAGEEPGFDLASFASLARGDYLATQEMAVLLGEESMQWVVHQGMDGGVVLVPLHPMLILAVVFDGRTTLGLVRHAMRKDRERLRVATEPLLGLLERQDLEADLEADLEEPGNDDMVDRIIGDGLGQIFGPSA